MQGQNIPAALATSSDVAWLCLLKIWTGTGADALYVVNNSEAIVSRGQRYEPFPFQVTLPSDDSESMPQVRLTLANVDAAIIEFVREQATAPNIVIELITSAFPDVVEKSLTFLKLINVSYDAMTIEGQLNVDDFLAQKFPAEAYVPPLFPALFR